MAYAIRTPQMPLSDEEMAHSVRSLQRYRTSKIALAVLSVVVTLLVAAAAVYIGYN